MTERVRRAAVALGIVALAVAAAGCGGDDEPQLLRGADLPSSVASSGTGATGFPKVGRCSGVNDALDRASTTAWADRGYRYWTYTLESGDSVSATVMAFDDPEAAQQALSELTDERDACVAEPVAGIVLEPLAGLPDGAVGYRATSPTSSGDETGAFAVAPVGDGTRLVSVGVTRHHDEQPDADVTALLAAAERRAGSADLARQDG